MIINCVKTETQFTNVTNETFQQVIEMPFAVELSVHVHKLARNKELISMLSNLHLLISYDKLLKTETLSNAVVKRMESCNGVYIFPDIQHGSQLHFTINNVHFYNNTSDGKSEFLRNFSGCFPEKYDCRSKSYYQAS